MLKFGSFLSRGVFIFVILFVRDDTSDRLVTLGCSCWTSRLLMMKALHSLGTSAPRKTELCIILVMNFLFFWNFVDFILLVVSAVSELVLLYTHLVWAKCQIFVSCWWHGACNDVTKCVAGKCHEKCSRCRVLCLSSMARGINENILIVNNLWSNHPRVCPI
jgi:hypothetical protein